MTVQNCPTLWRIYTYYSPSDRAARQTERANATDWKAEALGRVANVDYCYNCAGDGHLGDVRASFPFFTYYRILGSELVGLEDDSPRRADSL